MQKDCDLAFYDLGNKLWSSGTAGKGQNCYLSLQVDGNLVIYSGTNKALWATNTNGKFEGTSVLVVQPDRNVVLYGPSMWGTGTDRVGTANVTSTKHVVISGNKKISMVTHQSEK
ncbi:hypothetical protein LUZ63_008240 [Rhynchospora breviuscula]|uniref:non-specific serine/threonine protein kinase n=1 Tax=Rhynchospora breviuscula TaxID=2022672 RepID=A0A9Q0CT52_9POAL|nr:hypothetical protein LUZ63_008240 [Rhynchospora breviuscula]